MNNLKTRLADRQWWKARTVWPIQRARVWLKRRWVAWRLTHGPRLSRLELRWKREIERWDWVKAIAAAGYVYVPYLPVLWSRPADGRLHKGEP